MTQLQADGASTFVSTGFSWVWNGSDFEACDSIPLTDRGFRYGMSVFESIRVWNGVPLFFAEHLERLRRACAQCVFHMDDSAFASTEKLLRENGDGFARIYVTAGDGAITAPVAQPRIAVFIEPREPTATSVYEKGYALAISPEPHHPLFGGLKTANYWTNAHALGVVRARGNDEALLFNPAGELISACMSNVFVVRGEKITTPPLESGARDGVVRAWVCATCEVRQRAITRADLAGAEEIFLTNSWLSVMPVSSLEDRPLRSTSASAAIRVVYEDWIARAK